MPARHNPDDKTRKTVEAMSSYGIPQEDIAKVIGIDPKTLRKHYEHELDTATAKANAQVAQRLYSKCLEGDTTSMIFWMKTRAKWSESMNIDHTTKGEKFTISAEPSPEEWILKHGASGMAATSGATKSTD